MTVQTADREATEAAQIEGYVVVDDETAEAVGFLKVARRHERGWKERKETLTAKVKDVLGDAKGAIHNGHVVAEVGSRNGQRSVNFDLLAAKYPEAYAECVAAGKPQKVLNLK